MKRLLNICLILTSLVGYMEWGGGNSSFLWQAEYELIVKMLHDPKSVIHPFILIPMGGQLLLLITVFQQTPNRKLTIAGLACMSLIMVFLFAIGLMSMNMKIALSAVPFIVTGIMVLRYNRKMVK